VARTPPAHRPQAPAPGAAGVARSPIYGDAKYGSDRPFGPAIGLHARSLGFLHPTTREPLTVTAECRRTGVAASPGFWRAGVRKCPEFEYDHRRQIGRDPGGDPNRPR